MSFHHRLMNRPPPPVDPIEAKAAWKVSNLVMITTRAIFQRLKKLTRFIFPRFVNHAIILLTVLYHNLRAMAQSF